MPLLQSDGDEYISHFCIHFSHIIQKLILDRHIEYEFKTSSDQASLQEALTGLSLSLGKCIVLLFDDAAHIGREKPLEAFLTYFGLFLAMLSHAKLRFIRE